MKSFKLLLIFLSAIILQGCSFNLSPRYFHFEENQSNNHYYNELKEKLSNNEKYTLQVFDTNLYKYFSVDDEDNDILKNFINSLDTPNFLDEPTDDYKNIEKFKIIIKFDDESKYIIEVYNERFAKTYPWDGRYEEDFIDMEGIPPHYNLYDFCKYVQNKK